VYRGRVLTALVGSYLYGDYVSGKIWALRYDEGQRLVANRPVQDRSLPILSFGEDEQGEVYYLTYTTTGQGIYRFAAARNPRTEGKTPSAELPSPARPTDLPRERLVGLSVGNASGRLVALTRGQWGGLARRKLEVRDNSGKTTTYEGVAVADLLRAVGVGFGKDLKGPLLSNYMLVEAADGYRVVFSLAELDPERTDNVALLADRLDGKALSERYGPFRLIVPHEKSHSRWVRQVTRITVQKATAP
jgi:hypothetical protein